jgi:hypothetical protein
MVELYSQVLTAELKPEEIVKLIPRAVKEAKFWPSPAVLLGLAGILTGEEKQQREAGDALLKVLNSLKPVRSDPRRLDLWLVEADARRSQGDRIVLALERFGAGDIRTAVEMLLLHPRLRGSSFEAESMGLELVAIEKLERRWLTAWKEYAQ